MHCLTGVCHLSKRDANTKGLAGLSLVQKGILLVALPLLFELGFLASFGWLLYQAESEAAHQAHSNTVAAHCESLIKSFYNGATYLIAFGALQSPAVDENFTRCMAAIKKHESSLQVLVADDPAERRLLAELLPTIDSGVVLFSQTKARLEEDRNAWVFMKTQKLTNKIQTIVAKLLPGLQQLADLERRKADASPFAEARTRLLIKQVLVAAALFNILLAVALAVYVTRGLTRRISVLVENTNRLAHKEALLPQQSGNDEIALLDKTFHEMSASLEAAERVKQEFVAMVGHDLKTPLTFLHATLALTAMGKLDPATPEGLHKIKEAEEETNRLVLLVSDLLDVARLEAGAFQVELKPLPLWLVIERSAKAVSALAESAGVQVQIPRTDAEVMGDADRLEQVLVNLLANAIKASPANGTITVDALEFKDYHQVKVTDQGPGIAEVDQSIIFERFQQGRSEATRKDGLGLGLAICKAIVDEHHGEIGVDSRPGAGSCFWIRIPRAPAS